MATTRKMPRNITTTDSGETKHYIGILQILLKNVTEITRNHSTTGKRKWDRNIKIRLGHLEKRRPFTINWLIVKRAATYLGGAKCMAPSVWYPVFGRKACYHESWKTNILNKRSELVSKCRHQRKFSIWKVCRSKGKYDESTDFPRTATTPPIT